MASTFALKLTKWTLDVATRLIKADIRLHNGAAIEDDQAIIFVVNHFTRLETILLPYILYTHTGKEVCGLAAAELFHGPLGKFLRSTGTISVKDPDRDTTIIRSLLLGEQPWMIFPEGSMIKDKKVVDHAGEFRVFSNGRRRPPHTGAGVLALRAEFYRHKIACLAERPNDEGLKEALELFDLSSVEEVLKKRTVIIPINITYFPIRSSNNLLLNVATRFYDDLEKRAVEELSVEGTVLGEDTDIDIRLGEPIDVREILDGPQYASVMACGLNDMVDLERDAASLFNAAARDLMVRYMRAIYQSSTINYDHIFATIVRHQEAHKFTERAYRNRIFLCVHQLEELGYKNLHSVLESTYRDIVYEDPSEKFNNFINLSRREGVLTKEQDAYVKNFARRGGEAKFHVARWEEMTNVIANEIEPIEGLTELIKKTARMPRKALSKRIREIFIEEDRLLFEESYAKFYDPQESKAPEIGRPFLLRPTRVIGGVVLSHGYLSAPQEVRALAEYLSHRGYAVYCVRLAGHGTAPEELSGISWEQWYASFNRGYAVIKSITDKIFLGGFSMGGCLALRAAARKGDKVRGVFSINAPLQVQNYSVQLVPSIVTLNSLLKKLGRSREAWEFVVNEPENAHINYTRNPLTGIRELVYLMEQTEGILSDIHIPAFVLQGGDDPVVNPVSGQLIFEKMPSKEKEMTLIARRRHGIVNGDGAEDVFQRVHQFLQKTTARGTEKGEIALE